MGTVHQLIDRHGIEVARAMAQSSAERTAIEAAAAIMAEEESRLGITHAGFAMTSLPHKRLDGPVWRRQGGATTLLVESGRDAQSNLIGVPYGSMARLILLYLQTEAVRTNNPEVDLGRSMRSWLGRMAVTPGGKTYQLVREQARRISACRLTFLTVSAGAEQRMNGAFVRGAISMVGMTGEDRQPALWEERVRLDEGFWASLRDHPVPIREEAIRAIGTRSSMAMDIYIWLAYRLHALVKSTPITWAAIQGQFGAGYRTGRNMRPVFLDALQLALAVYPEAKVDLDDGRGLILHPSAPAVPKQTARMLGLT
jgi:hypothetical protein